MAEVEVKDSSLAHLQGQVVLVTGCSSGIGRATVEELKNIGAKVIGGDISEPKGDLGPDFSFLKTNVSDWNSLVALFKLAVEKHGELHHVFANAGSARHLDLFKDELDSSGNLAAPDYSVTDINLKGVMSTMKLAVHHMRKMPATADRSIVITTSPGSWMYYPAAEYPASKHAVLGLIRGLGLVIGPGTDVPIRLNGIAPSFTETGMLDGSIARAAGIAVQQPRIPAISALKLMADADSHQKVLYTIDGRFWEIEKAMTEAARAVVWKCAGQKPRTRSEEDELTAYIKALGEKA